MRKYLDNTHKNEDEALYSEASSIIIEGYSLNKHHVSSVLLCGDLIYYSLHLDTSGLDFCAEPVAISNAMISGERSFDKIISVKWDGNEKNSPEVIPPCGNCRQMLFEYFPDIIVILSKSDDQFITAKSSDLLPFPYCK